jgi:guanylate kinase
VSERAERGGLIVIAAPSGAGKTTLVRALLERLPDLVFSVSHTTRRPRPSERDGVDYFFVDEPRFRRMLEAGEFLEHALVFDYWYGTSRANVEALRARGKTVLLEIDWQGARQVRKKAPDAVGIFILPPDVAELERRLRGRRTDSEEVVAGRLREAVSDMSHWDEFDYVVINDRFEDAADALESIVRGRGEAHATTQQSVRDSVAALLGG